MSLNAIKRVLVVGAGTMGQQISLQCSAHGFPVVLNDVSDEQLDKAWISLRRFASQMATDLNLTDARVNEILAGIERITDPAAAAADVDLLIESVPEDVWLKRSVFSKFDEYCPCHTVFATNTSTLLPKDLATKSKRPGQFAALHFHPNVWDANVVDVMPSRTSAPELAETLKTFALAIGQHPIVFDREYRGYVINRFLFGIFREALSMVALGVASPEDIDLAFTRVLKAETGPCGLMDRVGLDTMLSINEFWCKRLLQLPRLDPVYRRNRKLLESYVSQGHLGVKSGRGFYCYSEPGIEASQQSERPADLLTR